MFGGQEPIPPVNRRNFYGLADKRLREDRRLHRHHPGRLQVQRRLPPAQRDPLRLVRAPGPPRGAPAPGGRPQPAAEHRERHGHAPPAGQRGVDRRQQPGRRRQVVGPGASRARSPPASRSATRRSTSRGGPSPRRSRPSSTPTPSGPCRTPSGSSPPSPTAMRSAPGSTRSTICPSPSGCASWPACAGTTGTPAPTSTSPSPWRTSPTVTNAWNPRLGLVVEPTKSQMYYFTYGTSSNPSAEALSQTLNAANQNLDPETEPVVRAGRQVDPVREARHQRRPVPDREDQCAHHRSRHRASWTLDGKQRVRRLRDLRAGGDPQGLEDLRRVHLPEPEDRSRRSTSRTACPSRATCSPTCPESSVNLWTTYNFTWHWPIQVGGGAIYASKRYANATNSRRRPATSPAT